MILVIRVSEIKSGPLTVYSVVYVREKGVELTDSPNYVGKGQNEL